MKYIDSKQLAELQKQGKVKKIATQRKYGETFVDITALATLIVTTNETIRGLQETNRAAMDYVKGAMDKLSIERPSVEAPAVYMPPWPEPPPPPKSWRFDVKRGSDGLIDHVIATRTDEADE